MTRQEMKERFGIPEMLLNDYEQNVRRTPADTYTDADLAVLSQMVTLYELGFSARQVREYLCASPAERDAVRLSLLNRKRQELLNTLHQQEEQLDKLDFLRYEIQKNGGTNI